MTLDIIAYTSEERIVPHVWPLRWKRPASADIFRRDSVKCHKGFSERVIEQVLGGLQVREQNQSCKHLG